MGLICSCGWKYFYFLLSFKFIDAFNSVNTYWFTGSPRIRSGQLLAVAESPLQTGQTDMVKLVCTAFVNCIYEYNLEPNKLISVFWSNQSACAALGCRRRNVWENFKSSYPEKLSQSMLWLIVSTLHFQGQFSKTLKIKLFTHVISFNTLWEESGIFLQIKLFIGNGSNIGLSRGFLRIFLNILQK